MQGLQRLVESSNSIIFSRMVVVGVLILSAIVGRLAANLDARINQEIGLAWDAKLELRKLSSVLSTIETALQTAEEMSSHSQAMLEWLQKLQDAADDATILLDSFFSTSGYLIPFSNRFPYLNRPAHAIKNIKERLEAIAKEKDFHLKVEGTRPSVAVEEATEPALPRSKIYEREEAKEEIVKFLLDNTCQEELSVIPIVGIPGIGKTTVAKLAFNDKRVMGHFSNGFMIWVWVSEGFDVKKIAQDIIQCAQQVHRDTLNLNQTKLCLQEILHGKKFLLVLDNVWNESGKKWDELKHMLGGGNHGSKVIVTTCNNKVANIMKTTNPRQLEGLTESACWSIFAKTAFRGGQNTNQFFEENGRKIAYKSEGLPLAAEALGRLMLQKTDESEWLSVKNSEIWNLAEENEILSALKLSYKHLPQHSYRCLAYCSIFPKDHEIDKEKLIKLWIAHDFIPPKGSKELEDIGHDTVKHLLDRFFFQPLQKDEDGRIMTFKLQGLIYDLARCEMETSINRHFCCNMKTSSNIHEDVQNAKYLRTLFLLNSPERYVADIMRSTFNKFKLLRALDLSNSQVTSLPNSVGNLIHLRYLDLSGTEIEKLPEVLCRLKDLQSLILKRCSKLSKLPAGMRKMSSLRHLDIDECESLVQMPHKIRQLRFLQTLPIFNVGEKKGCRIGELGALSLRGKLNIRCLGNVVSISDAEDANLKEKEHLSTLSLSWEANNCKDSANVGEVLDALQPHKYLKRLSVREYMGKRFPSWLKSYYLPNLVGITLINCRRCQHLPPLGELPFLKSLTIDGLDSVQLLGKAFYGSSAELVAFPSLEEFNCLNMICLKSWESERKDLFPRLSVLIIKRCPKLSNLPRLPSRLHRRPNTLRHLEIVHCPHLHSMKELENLHALKTLKMRHCEGLMSLPEGLKNLTSLESLEVDNCHNLTSLPKKGLEGLHSLGSLFIRKCRNLTTLSEGLQHLINLHTLNITGCPNLLSLQEGKLHLVSLNALMIHSCVKLASLPRGALKDMQISGCPSLIALPEWAKNLKHLESLVIENCQTLQFLPPGMKNMTELKKLHIRNCCSLVELPGWLTDLKALKTVQILNCDSLRQIPAGLRQKTTMSVLIQGCCQLKERQIERSRNWQGASASKVRPMDR